MASLNLTQTARFIKSELLLIILVVSATGILILSFFYSNRNKTPETPQGAAWRNTIYPGETTKDKLESTIGKPAKISEKDGATLYSYSTKSQSRLHEVELTGDVVKTIKEQVVGDQTQKLNSYIQQYGTAEKEIFGNYGQAAPGFLWATKGLLVFANKFDGTIFEIWYFVPTSVDEFLRIHPQLKTELPQHPTQP